MKNPLRRRVLGALASVAVVAGATLFGAGAASAAPTIPDADAIGSITIHKHEQTVTPTTEGNGLPTTVDPANAPMAGVEFTIRPVQGFDLTTNAGWLALTDLDIVEAKAAATGAPIAVTTDAAGVASFPNLPIGAYYVEETLYPAGYVPSAPFVVTVPITHPTQLDTWLYDVHVYPKNKPSEDEKTVEDFEDHGIGDEIVYTITSAIPTLPAGETNTGYRVRDQLDSKLTYVRTAVQLLDGATTTALVENTDYVLAHDTATNTVLVTFQAAGLLKLDANPTAKVQTLITTTVNAIGEIENEATVFPDQPSWDNQSGTTTPPVETKWGNFSLLKVDAEDNAVTLAGVEFQVFLTADDAAARTNPVSVNGVTTFVTDSYGQLTISGLRYSDFANGQVVAPGDAGYQTYFLVETKALDGYELLAEPVEFTVTNGDTTLDLTIENTPKGGGFELPLTGGSGLWLFPIGGALLLGGAAFLLFGRRRRSQAG